MRVVIVGASAAGVTAAETLRRKGFDGHISLIGAEPELPYDRPPLSKQVFTGGWEPSRIRLRTPEQLAALELDLRLDTAVRRIDRDRRAVLLSGGEPVAFDRLLIATGVRPRELGGHPANPAAGVHVLRTLADALALRAGLRAGGRLVVIGAGVLGMEVAAAARQHGAEVTVLGRQPLPLAGLLGVPLAGTVLATHREHGVRLVTGVPVRGLVTGADRVRAVELADGRRLPADLVLVAIGSVPATEWLHGSGIPVGDGVECDEYCAAGEGVWAAGDVARWRHPELGTSIRVEHRVNATEQAALAAGNLLDPGSAVPYLALPSFWTHQFDLRIQVVGRVGDPAGRLRVAERSEDGRSVAALSVVGDRVTGAVCVNRPRRMRELRELVGSTI